MNKEQLNEWGYPIHPKSDYSKPPEGDFATWIGLILVFWGSSGWSTEPVNEPHEGDH